MLIDEPRSAAFIEAEYINNNLNKAEVITNNMKNTRYNFMLISLPKIVFDIGIFIYSVFSEEEVIVVMNGTKDKITSVSRIPETTDSILIKQKANLFLRFECFHIFNKLFKLLLAMKFINIPNIIFYNNTLVFPENLVYL